MLQQAISFSFADDYKNILLLAQGYLVSPANSAEYEHGYGASNRMQTNGLSRPMADTLNTLLTIRLLLPDDICRYEQEYERQLASVI